MKLFYRKFGQGAPIVILHGLYGSSDNWVSIGRSLSENYEVWLIDQRNHGKSPHNNLMNYQLMQEDLLEFMNDNNLQKVILIGHSMGGKTAMQFAIENSEKVSRLIVLDIAPKSYLFSIKGNTNTLNHRYIIKTMLDLNFAGIQHRNELEDMMQNKIRSQKIRQFILKNVKRNDYNNFTWRLNINALYNNLEVLLDGFDHISSNIGYGVTGFPVLFVKGGNSDYIQEDDKEKIQSIFPYAEFQTLEDAGHWIHVEQPEELIKMITNFIE